MMSTFKVTLTVFILFSVLALCMHSANAASSRIRDGVSSNSHQSKNKASDSPFLFARNREYVESIFMQVDVEAGSFIKMNNNLPSSVGMSLDEATRTVYARDNNNIYSINADSLELIKSIPIVSKHPIVDLHYDNGFNKLIGIIGIKGGDQYGFVEIGTDGKPNLLLEFQGRFHRTAYDPINHMYYTTSVEDGSISQFNMTHNKLQRTYPLPARLTGLAVNGHSNTLYACAQHGTIARFAKLDLKTGKLYELKSDLPGVVEALGAFDLERGIYYGATRIEDIMHQLLEINVESGEIVTKTLAASFYDAVFVPPKK